MPSGPGVMVLPGSGKSFDQFRFDDYECRQYASSQIGGNTPDQAAADSGVKSAVVGAAIGTVAGAALGGSQGAIAGAGIGTAGGALAGTGAASRSGYTLQQRYDIGYTQCMYAKGHKIPTAGHSDNLRRPVSSYAPPQSGAYTQQPPAYGTPPPPPPGYGPPPPGSN